MPTTTMSYTLTIKNRQQMRNDIVDLFKNEQPGTGTGAKAARYIYEVEILTIIKYNFAVLLI